MSEWDYLLRNAELEISHQAGMDKDYRVKPLGENDLANLGADGWELVQVVPITVLKGSGTGLQPYEYVQSLQYIFKRPGARSRRERLGLGASSSPKLIKCPHCGTDQANSRYCSACGQPIV